MSIETVNIVDQNSILERMSPTILKYPAENEGSTSTYTNTTHSINLNELST